MINSRRHYAIIEACSNTNKRINYNSNTLVKEPDQHDWHCMAYAIYLLKQYHDGEI